jgi:hypothetical protein
VSKYHTSLRNSVLKVNPQIMYTYPEEPKKELCSERGVKGVNCARFNH